MTENYNEIKTEISEETLYEMNHLMQTLALDPVDNIAVAIDRLEAMRTVVNIMSVQLDAAEMDMESMFLTYLYDGMYKPLLKYMKEEQMKVYPAAADGEQA